MLDPRPKSPVLGSERGGSFAPSPNPSLYISSYIFNPPV